MNEFEDIIKPFGNLPGKKLSKSEGENYFKRVRGSDPRVATCRGKLQFRRSKLNQEINKQLLIRNGAERLLLATKNKKQKENVALELSFINSNLQLLKEQLSELNSSVHIYQNSTSCQMVPMIPLGLKETKIIDFNDVFKDFILEHYSDEMAKFEVPIKTFTETREALRTPARDNSGIRLLFEYYNTLYFIDRRFFTPHRSLGIFFEWFDSLTGVPSSQKTIAFEKASILFNIAALYTQIGAKQERTANGSIEAAVDNFLRSAGMLHYLNENFSNAPSTDLTNEVLDLLEQLMLAQARECLFEKLLLACQEKPTIEKSLEVAQEAAFVAKEYSQLQQLISLDSIKSAIPTSWLSLILVKHEHYKAMAHHHVAIALLDHTGELSDQAKQTLLFIHVPDNCKSQFCLEITVPKTPDEKMLLGKSHMREALLLHEEALRLHRMCRQLRQVDTLQKRLRMDHDISLNRYAQIEDEDNFQEVMDPLPIQPVSKYTLSLTQPDFSLYKVKDPFIDLGPLAIFSARHYWTAPRNIYMEKQTDETFGFSVRGDCPVIIAGVDIGSQAQSIGIKPGDFIVSIEDKDTKWSKHEEIVSMIKAMGNVLTMRIVTPMDRNYLTNKMSSSTSSSGISSGSSFPSPISQKNKRMSWNFFRRSTHSKLSDDYNSSFNQNIVLR